MPAYAVHFPGRYIGQIEEFLGMIVHGKIAHRDVVHFFGHRGQFRAFERHDREHAKSVKLGRNQKINRHLHLFQRFSGEAYHGESVCVDSERVRDFNVLFYFIQLNILLDQLLQARRSCFDCEGDEDSARLSKLGQLLTVQYVAAHSIWEGERDFHAAVDDAVAEFDQPIPVQVKNVIHDFKIAYLVGVVKMLDFVKEILRAAAPEHLAEDIVAVYAVIGTAARGENAHIISQTPCGSCGHNFHRLR